MKKVIVLSADEIIKKLTQEELDYYYNSSCPISGIPHKRSFIYVDDFPNVCGVRRSIIESGKFYFIEFRENISKEITYSTWIPKVYTMNISQQIEIDFGE